VQCAFHTSDIFIDLVLKSQHDDEVITVATRIVIFAATCLADQRYNGGVLQLLALLGTFSLRSFLQCARFSFALEFLPLVLTLLFESQPL